jgi:hypothetical protein
MVVCFVFDPLVSFVSTPEIRVNLNDVELPNGRTDVAFVLNLDWHDLTSLLSLENDQIL